MPLVAKKGWLVVACGLAAIAGGVGYSVHREGVRAERERLDAAGQAWADLWQCALGGMVASEEVATRARLIALGEPPSGWPASCAVHASALYQRLESDEPHRELRHALAERFACDVACRVDEPAAQFVGLSLPAGLPTLPPRVEGPPRLDSMLVRKQQFASFGGSEARVIVRDVAPDGSARLLVRSPSRGHELCAVRPDEGTVSCTALAIPAAEGTLELFAGGEEALLRGRERPGDPPTSYLADGQPVDSYAGRRQGFVLSRREGGGHQLSRVRDGALTDQKALEIEGAAVVAADHLLWLDPHDGKPTLFARPLGADEALLGPAVVLGPAASAKSPPRLCAAGDSTVALFGSAASGQTLAFFAGGRWHAPIAVPLAAAGSSRGEALSPPRAPKPAPRSGDDQATARAGDEEAAARSGDDEAARARQAALKQAAELGMIGLLNQGGGDDPPSPWAQVLAQEAQVLAQEARRKAASGEPREANTGEPLPELASPRIHLPRQAFGCSAAGASLTWRDETSEEIHQVRCTPERCEHRAVHLPVSPQSWWHASAHGDQTLVVWRARRGELRLRLAPLEQLPLAKDVIVMDAAEYGGPATVDLEVFVGSRGAIFWFRGMGYHALAIDERGRYRAIDG